MVLRVTRAVRVLKRGLHDGRRGDQWEFARLSCYCCVFTMRRKQIIEGL